MKIVHANVHRIIEMPPHNIDRAAVYATKSEGSAVRAMFKGTYVYYTMLNGQLFHSSDNYTWFKVPSFH